MATQQELLDYEQCLFPEQILAKPRSERGETDLTLDIIVVYTSAGSTRAALKYTGRLANRLGGKIVLLVFEVVPYPLPLASPPVLLTVTEGRCREIASESPLDIYVCLYLCRDPLETLKRVLPPHSLILAGVRQSWWPGRDRILAHKLRSAGHEVILIETE